MGLYIQLIGQTGAGKSFIARKLAEVTHGIVIPFAKDVYRLAAIVKGGQIDKSKPEDRELLKLIGTTWGRESRGVSPEIQKILDRHKPQEWGTPDIWARIFVSNCRRLPPNVSVINDDTRFLNELKISMASLGFIPILVACREETRQKRLRVRGDMHDPSDTEHLSEELANFLRKRALVRALLPVIWNDSDCSKPPESWIHSWSDFLLIAEQSGSNRDLAQRLGWTPEKATYLVSVIKKELDWQRR